MFFAIPRATLVRIISLLNAAVVLQLLQQVARLVWSDYEGSETPPGQLVILSTFVPSILCAVGGGALQFRALYHLHLEHPECYPPSALVVALSGVAHRWAAGERNAVSLLYGSMIEFKEATEGGAEARRRSVADRRLSIGPEGPVAAGSKEGARRGSLGSTGPVGSTIRRMASGVSTPRASTAVVADLELASLVQDEAEASVVRGEAEAIDHAHCPPPSEIGPGEAGADSAVMGGRVASKQDSQAAGLNSGTLDVEFMARQEEPEPDAPM